MRRRLWTFRSQSRLLPAEKASVVMKTAAAYMLIKA